MSDPIVLHVMHPDGARERLEWPEDRSILKIGRHERSHVRLRDPEAARMHAVLEEVDGEVFVIDLGSPIGTKVDGRDINEAKLDDGAVIEIGSTRVRVEAPRAEGSRPLPSPAPTPRVGRCPRCDGALQLLQSEPTGYRDVPMRFLRCGACALSVVEPATLEARFGGAYRFDDLPALRTREAGGGLCPACLDGLDRVTLEWDSRWVAIEECPGCGCVVLDDGEGMTLGAMITALGGSTDRR